MNFSCASKSARCPGSASAASVCCGPRAWISGGSRSMARIVLDLRYGYMSKVTPTPPVSAAANAACRSAGVPHRWLACTLMPAPRPTATSSSRPALTSEP